VHGDVCDVELVDKLVAEVDAIAHFAAESHVDRSIDDPAEFLRTNVTGAGVVFAAARRHEIPQVLHISTDEVYGSIEPPGSFSERDALWPNSPYAASKAAADLLARAYQETYGFPITVSRTTNNFGPYHYPEKVVPLFVTNLIDEQPVPLYGDGSNVRDWTFVEDNAAAQWLILTEGTAGETYNVGAGNERTNRDLTYAILAHFGLTGEAADEHIDFVVDRPGHDHRYSVDSSKMRALGWRPALTFDEALDRPNPWYRDNERWWRPLKQAGASGRQGLRQGLP
jgi:dTDP-glucose 4,6-dehydratase